MCSYLPDILKIVKERYIVQERRFYMKLHTLNNNAHVLIDNHNLFHLFSYDSEVLVYNPRDNGITVYTNIANYSVTTKKHVRMFCDKFLDDLDVVPAILDPKKNCWGYKILHIINE